MIKSESVRSLVPVTMNTQPARCPDGCEHHNAITCIATTEHISRFEAMLTYIVGDIDTQFGGCSCPCHRTHDNKQVSEQAWLARVRREYKPDRRTSRRRNQDVALKFVAEPAPFAETRGRKSAHKESEVLA